MKILAISDCESRALWDFYTPGKLEGLDLILSCGDLDPRYLSFLATFASCPILYVHGNHDGKYRETPPAGCLCVEDRLYEYQGVRILGLGGSMRYSRGPHQYTEREMCMRALKLAPKLLWNRGFDILLTHSPGFGMVDCRDLAHTGFQTFNRLLDLFHPALFLHGHTHLSYNRGIRRRSSMGVPGWSIAMSVTLWSCETDKPAGIDKNRSAWGPTAPGAPVFSCIQPRSCLMALISTGTICFFRLITPGRTAIPSVTVVSKAFSTRDSAPLPAISSSVLELRTSVNM